MILSLQQYDDLWTSLKNAHTRCSLLTDRLELLEREVRELRSRSTPLDHRRAIPEDKRCTLCGSVRYPLSDESGRYGACSSLQCAQPLYDFENEQERHQASPNEGETPK